MVRGVTTYDENVLPQYADEVGAEHSSRTYTTLLSPDFGRLLAVPPARRRIAS